MSDCPRRPFHCLLRRRVFRGVFVRPFLLVTQPVCLRNFGPVDRPHYWEADAQNRDDENQNASLRVTAGPTPTPHDAGDRPRLTGHALQKS